MIIEKLNLAYNDNIQATGVIYKNIWNKQIEVSSEKKGCSYRKISFFEIVNSVKELDNPSEKIKKIVRHLRGQQKEDNCFIKILSKIQNFITNRIFQTSKEIADELIAKWNKPSEVEKSNEPLNNEPKIEKPNSKDTAYYLYKDAMKKLKANKNKINKELKQIIEKLLELKQDHRVANIYAICCANEINKELEPEFIKLIEKFCNDKHWENYFDKEGLNLLRTKLKDYEPNKGDIYEIISIFRDYRLSSEEEVSEKLGRTIKLTQTKEIQTPSQTYKIDTQKFDDQHAAVAFSQGPRPSMEDEHLATKISFEINGKKYEGRIFAVFDGHSGNECSKYLKENIQKYLKKELETCKELKDVNIFNSLKLAMVKANQAFNDQSGSTASIALVLNNSLWFANVGDARGLLGIKDKKGKIKTIQLSEDAKAGTFESSVNKRGGHIGFYGIPRLNACLAVERAFGDERQRGLTARPKITKINLSELDQSEEIQLLIACDGIWDVLGSEEAMKIVLQNSKSQVERATDLIKECFKYMRFSDNATVLTANLKK